MIEKSIEELVFEFIDQCKILFFPEQWNRTFLDYSKNEVFALYFVYRKGHSNMSELADYLGVPLNTATGIVSRLEKRGVIKRDRDLVDKRVVTIELRPEGREFLKEQFKIIERYFFLFMNQITEDEKKVLVRLIGKFLEVVSQDFQMELQQGKKKEIRKIVIE